MLRIVATVGFCMSFSASLMADAVCVACDEPAASYRCTFESPVKSDKLKVGGLAQEHVCEKVLALANSHTRCRAIAAPAEPCTGTWHTVTIGDYQRLTAKAEGEEITYEPGLIKRTQDGVQDSVQSTWTCISSLFGDC
jgi:hypothetical protein